MDLDMPELVSSDEEPEYYEVNNDKYVQKWMRLGQDKLKEEEGKIVQQVLGPFLFGFDIVAPNVWIHALQHSGALKSLTRSFETSPMEDSEIEVAEFLKEVIKQNRHVIREAKALRDVLDMIAQIEKNSVSTELIQPVRAIDTAMEWPLCHEAWKALSTAGRQGTKFCFCLVFFYKIVQHHVTAFGISGNFKSDALLRAKMKDPEMIKSAKDQANTFFQLEQYPYAVDMYGAAIRQDCLTDTLYGNRALAYLNAKFYREAYCDARRAMFLNENSPKFYYSCAEACIHLDRLEEAEKMSKRGAELCKKSHEDFKTKLQIQLERVKKAMEEKTAVKKKKMERKITAEGLETLTAPPTEQPVPKPASSSNIKKNKEENAVKATEKPLEQLSSDQEKENYEKFVAAADEALAALQQEENAVRAFGKYQVAHELWSHSPFVKSKLTSTESLVLQYALGISAILQDNSKTMQEGLEIFQGMLKEADARNFPLLYYGMGRAFAAFYRFSDALEPVGTGLRLAQELKNDWAEVCWPCSEQVIPESRLPTFKRVMGELLTLCRYPPAPDATCSMHVDHDSEHLDIYFQSPTFTGYTQISCHLKCRITFHPLCWKQHKLSVGEKARDKDILNQKCPTPDCGSAIYKIFICRTGSKMDNKELISSVKPVKEPSRCHKAMRMRLSNPDRIAKKAERKEARRQKRQEALEERLRAARTEEEPEHADGTHLLPDHDEERDAFAVPADTTLTVLDREKGEEGVKYHGFQKSVRQKKKKEKVKHVLNVEVSFSDNREATLLGEDDADGDLNKKSRAQNNVASTTDSFAVPPHLKPQVQSLASIVATTPAARASDSTVVENLFEFFNGILSEHGPLCLNDPVLLHELSELPSEARHAVTQAGGPAGFFRKSLKFVVIGDIVANIQDTKRAHEIARKMYNPREQPADGTQRKGSIAQPVLEPSRITQLPSAPISLSGASAASDDYLAVVRPVNSYISGMIWSSPDNETAQDCALTDINYSQSGPGADHADVQELTGSVGDPYCEFDMENDERYQGRHLNPSAPEFRPGHAQAVTHDDKCISNLHTCPTVDNSLYPSIDPVTLGHNSDGVNNDQSRYASSGARPKDRWAQGYNSLDTFPQTDVEKFSQDKTSVNGIDDIDDLNLPVEEGSVDLSVHDMDSIDDYNVLPSKAQCEVSMVEIGLRRVSNNQVSQLAEQDVTISRRSSRSELSQTSDISMGGLFRTSSPSSSVSSVKIGSARDASSPHMRDVSSPLVIRDVSSPQTLRDTSTSQLMRDTTVSQPGHENMSSSSSHDAPALLSSQKPSINDTAFSEVIGTSELGFGENFVSSLDKLGSSALPESPVPYPLSDSPTLDDVGGTSFPQETMPMWGTFSKFSCPIGTGSDRYLSAPACPENDVFSSDTKDGNESNPAEAQDTADLSSSLSMPKPLKPLMPMSGVMPPPSVPPIPSSCDQPSLSLAYPLKSSDTWAPISSTSVSSGPGGLVPSSEIWSDNSFPSSVRPEEDLTSCVSFPSPVCPAPENLTSSVSDSSALHGLDSPAPLAAFEVEMPPPLPLPSFSLYSKWSNGQNDWDCTVPGRAVISGRQLVETGVQTHADTHSVLVNTDIDLQWMSQLEEENGHVLQQLNVVLDQNHHLQMSVQHSQTERLSQEREMEEVKKERNTAVQQMNNLQADWDKEKKEFVEREVRFEKELKSMKERNSLSALETANLLQRVSEMEKKFQAEEVRAREAETEVVRVRMQLSLQQLERRKNEAEMHHRYTAMFARRCQEKDGHVPAKVREALTYWQTVMEAFGDKHAQVRRAFEQQLNEVQHGKRLSEVSPVSISPPPLPRMPEGMAVPNGQQPVFTNGSYGSALAEQSRSPAPANGHPSGNNMIESTNTTAGKDGAPPPLTATAMPRPLLPLRPISPLRPVLTLPVPAVPVRAPLRPPLATLVGVPTPAMPAARPQAADDGGAGRSGLGMAATAAAPSAAGAVAPRPLVETVPTPLSSFDKLVVTLQKSFPSCSRDDFSRLIQELRRAHGGSLSGMSLEFIVTRVTQMLIARGIKPVGDAQASVMSSGNSNNNNKSSSSSSKRVLAPPPGINPSWSVEGLEPSGEVEGDRFEDVDPCAICHEELSSAPVQTLDCTHRFHDKCIRTWFKQQTTCPNCRIYTPLHDEFPTLK